MKRLFAGAFLLFLPFKQKEATKFTASFLLLNQFLL